MLYYGFLKRLKIKKMSYKLEIIKSFITIKFIV